uniref:Uncharacterized protein n=1 Tax=viral metagenome TaxID=1070528 RepID=A0A6C0AET6_9ZZZZ
MNSFSNTVFESEKIITYKEKRRILSIEGLTGLKNISSAFEDPLNYSEVELLLIFFNKKFNFDLYDDVYDFILNVAKFSPRSLESIDANYEEFYYNMTFEEALEVILTKLIVNNGMEQEKGFPVEFNFTSDQKNKVQLFHGNKIFPYVGEKNNLDYMKIFNKVTRDIEI